MLLSKWLCDFDFNEGPKVLLSVSHSAGRREAQKVVEWGEGVAIC
jgi:hypothetical protein